MNTPTGKLFQRLRALMAADMVDELEAAYKRDKAAYERAARQRSVSFLQRKVLHILATIGADNQERTIRYSYQHGRQSATICTYHGLADNSAFEKVNISTMRALERGGYIRRVKRLGENKSYWETYELTPAGRKAAKVEVSENAGDEE